MGMDSWNELMNPRDLGKLFDTPEFACARGEAFDVREIETSAGAVRVGLVATTFVLIFDQFVPISRQPAFLNGSPGGSASLSDSERDALFRQFLQWREKQGQGGRPR